MKTIKEQADELVEKKLKLLCKSYQYPKKQVCVNLAILSVKHTIEILNNVITHDKERYGITCRGATIELDEQTELLTELESRL